MNYEALGNTSAHLHWHLIPRHVDDPRPGGPVWEDSGFLSALRSGSYEPTPERLHEFKQRLLAELSAVGGVVKRTF